MTLRGRLVLYYILRYMKTSQWMWYSTAPHSNKEDNKGTNVNTENNVNTEKQEDNWKVENE